MQMGKGNVGSCWMMRRLALLQPFFREGLCVVARKVVTVSSSGIRLFVLLVMQNLVAHTPTSLKATPKPVKRKLEIRKPRN